MRFLNIVAICSVMALSACAAVEFPKTGEVSPYDGKWSGALPSTTYVSCQKMMIDAEVKYGYLIGSITKGGALKAQVWGQIDKNGFLGGSIGQSGIAGGTGSAQFSGSSAEGTWEADGCTGTLRMSKVG